MLDAEQRTAIMRFDTCKIANAIESLGLRLRNEGFTGPGNLRSLGGGFPRALGYAATSKVKCADPPLKGYSYYDLADWWEVIARRPKPTIAVIQDTDAQPGQGAVLSDMHAEVLMALECVAVVTNGAVRDLPALSQMALPVFACHVRMSHAYVHMIDHGVPVEILGLAIAPEDLIYVDVHGVISIPESHAADIIRVAEQQSHYERTIIDLCRTPPFSLSALRKAVKHL